MEDVTQLIQMVGEGDREAADRLFAVVYGELRQLANAKMAHEANDHTLQSTALVHEVWLKLVGAGTEPVWNNREHFFSAAAQAMRRILVDSARTRKRIKRGGANQKFELQDYDATVEQDQRLLALDEALEQLKDQHELKARLVELRYFTGITNAQAAEQLGISVATPKDTGLSQKLG